MQIARIMQTRHWLPLEQPIQGALDPAPRDQFTVDLVWVETDAGHVGIASGPPMPDLTPYEHLFIGMDPLDLERHNRTIESLSFHVGACWPLDLALWDLVGKVHGKPVWQLLGGQDPSVRVFADLAGARAPDELALLTQDVMADGFPALGLRLDDPDMHTNLARVQAVREAAGENLVILADCAQAAPSPWNLGPPRSEADTRSLIAGLDELGVFWVEDPLHRADYKGLHDLRQMAGMNIAGGSAVREMHDIRNLIVRDAVDVLRADATRVGGITGLFPLARKARERGTMFSPHTFENGLAMIANAHMAAALGDCPCLAYPMDPPGLLPAHRDFLLTAPVLPDQDGWLTLSDAPGFGLEINAEIAAETQLVA